MKFNVTDKRSLPVAYTAVVPRGALGTISDTPTGITHEGGAGYQRDAKSELFLRMTTRFAGEPGFYEPGDENVERMRALVSGLAIDDETWPWVRDALPWLRGPGNIRTASILLAADAVHARLVAGKVGNGNKELISSVLQRADEPGEMLAYWSARYGTPRGDGIMQVRLPKPVKRGVAMAATRLYDEGSFLRWDKGGVRFGDVLEMTHAKPRVVGNVSGWQNRLFEWAITARHGRDSSPSGMTLPKVRARWELNRMSPDQRHAYAAQALIARAAMVDNNPFGQLDDAMAGQWEWVRSWLGPKPTYATVALTEAQQWQLVLPRVGYMALLRNLRNFDEADIDDTTAALLAARIADPEQVAKSRQLPFRFYSAYIEAPSLRWGHALDKALTACLTNVPTLSGRTLVLIDTSASMEHTVSNKSTMRIVTAAAIFGLSLKLKNPSLVDVFGFANDQFEVDTVKKGASLLKSVEIFRGLIGKVGHGTEIEYAVRSTFVPGHHDRVIILTDMQTFGNHWAGDVASAVPANIPVYAFNVSGYTNTAMPVVPGNNRYELGGLTDHTLAQILAMESAHAGTWPWEVTK